MYTFTPTYSRCLKITEKVSINITSEASYVYILSGQKLIENAKNGPFWRIFENLKLAVKQCYQIGQKLVENAKIEILKYPENPKLRTKSVFWKSR